jgi:hypothetical protein
MINVSLAVEEMKGMIPTSRVVEECFGLQKELFP